MQYKLKTGFNGVLKTDWNGHIFWVPNEPDNGDWQAYQRWLAQGNSPELLED